MLFVTAVCRGKATLQRWKDDPNFTWRAELKDSWDACRTTPWKDLIFPFDDCALALPISVLSFNLLACTNLVWWGCVYLFVAHVASMDQWQVLEPDHRTLGVLVNDVSGTVARCHADALENAEMLCRHLDVLRGAWILYRDMSSGRSDDVVHLRGVGIPFTGMYQSTCRVAFEGRREVYLLVDGAVRDDEFWTDGDWEPMSAFMWLSRGRWRIGPRVHRRQCWAFGLAIANLGSSTDLDASLDADLVTDYLRGAHEQAWRFTGPPCDASWVLRCYTPSTLEAAVRLEPTA